MYSFVQYSYGLDEYRAGTGPGGNGAIPTPMNFKIYINKKKGYKLAQKYVN